MHDSVAKSNMVSVQNLIRAANFDRSLRKIHLSVILHLHQSIDHFQAVWVFSKENILFLHFTWKVSSFKISFTVEKLCLSPELKTLEWDILNPDRIINLEIKKERRTSKI